ncbi:MAG: DUF2568 domain-containing protein [Deltaproteobacteria bacterium]|nr:DUF2568 domain-containing protein [Deltaproteobacteria bacterium]
MIEPPRVPPGQLVIRFGLEVGTLVAVGALAAHLAHQVLGGSDGQARFGVPLGAIWIFAWLAALLAAGLLAVLWTVFAVLGDPSRSGRAPVPVPGWFRLGLELAIFAAGALSLAVLGERWLLAIDLLALVVHHAGTLPRLRWLLRQP